MLIKKLADKTRNSVEENKAIIGVPVIVQPIVVAVEPAAVPVGVRHIPIAVRVPKLRQKPSVTPPREVSN